MEISGSAAIERMRNLKKVPNATFGLIFITCDLNRKEHGQIRKYERCRLRAAMVDEALAVSSDHYLYFEDMDTEQPRQCFKKLVRWVCFPPSNEWLKVNWFNGD
ncbi:MAG: hypothetical protein JW783_08260 [Bacteroidales bacterium]|nr:hypothetical protein [Bacteroidales bacterium]MBN2749934.1 hypothetical protein [Bacteroidales bacterium]